MAGASHVLREIEDDTQTTVASFTADIEYVNYKASSFSTDPEGDNSQSTKDYLKSLTAPLTRFTKRAQPARGRQVEITT